MFNFLGLNELASPRRNLAQEIDEISRFKEDLDKLTREQLITKIEFMNEEHKKTVSNLKTKIENDLAIAQALNKQTVDRYTGEVLKLERQIKQHQAEVTKVKQAQYQDHQEWDAKVKLLQQENDRQLQKIMLANQNERQLNQRVQMLQMLQIENQEIATTVQKLRDLVNERDETIQNMAREIEKLSNKLCEAQEALFDARRMST